MPITPVNSSSLSNGTIRSVRIPASTPVTTNGSPRAYAGRAFISSICAICLVVTICARPVPGLGRTGARRTNSPDRPSARGGQGIYRASPESLICEPGFLTTTAQAIARWRLLEPRHLASKSRRCCSHSPTSWSNGGILLRCTSPHLGRFCCKSLKTPGDKFPARRQNKPRSLIDVASGSLARSPVSLSPGDEVPHMFTRKPHPRLEEFAITCTKRLLQQNLPQPDPDRAVKA
jgi:hypothetical protein